MESVLDLDETKIMVDDWFQVWLEVYVVPLVERKVVDTFKADYQNYIRRYLGGMRLLEVQAEHIQNLIDCMFAEGCSVVTIREMVDLLNAGFIQACKNELIQKNPIQHAALPDSTRLYTSRTAGGKR